MWASRGRWAVRARGSVTGRRRVDWARNARGAEPLDPPGLFSGSRPCASERVGTSARIARGCGAAKPLPLGERRGPWGVADGVGGGPRVGWRGTVRELAVSTRGRRGAGSGERGRAVGNGGGGAVFAREGRKRRGEGRGGSGKGREKGESFLRGFVVVFALSTTPHRRGVGSGHGSASASFVRAPRRLPVASPLHLLSAPLPVLSACLPSRQLLPFPSLPFPLVASVPFLLSL